RIGFLAQARVLAEKKPALEQALATAKATGEASSVATAARALRTNEVQYFNSFLDAIVAGFFLALVCFLSVLSFWQWIMILSRKKPPELKETPPVWLPDYALNEPRSLKVTGVATLAFALARELSDEAHIERERLTEQWLCGCEGSS